MPIFSLLQITPFFEMDLAVVIYYFISPTVAGLTVILNLIEIVLLLKQYKRSTLARTQKHAIPIILFGNLALADLLVGLTVVAIKIMQILYRSYVIPVTRTNLQIFNILKYNFLRLSMLTSFFILIVLTMDRLYAVRYPFSYRSRANNKRAFILVLSTWVLAIAFTSIHYYVSFHSGINIGRYSLIIFPAVVIPATFAFPISNFVIVKAVRKNGQELRRLANNTSSNSDHTKTDDNKSNSTCKGQSAVGSGESRPTINEATLHIIRREAKIYRLALTVVIAFIVCWLPMAICGLLLIAKIHVDSQVINIVFTLAFANSVVNPLAYFCFNDNIRRKIKMLFNTCSRSCFLPQRAGIRDNAQVSGNTSSQIQGSQV